jgi:hypothetical protein
MTRRAVVSLARTIVLVSLAAVAGCGSHAVAARHASAVPVPQPQQSPSPSPSPSQPQIAQWQPLIPRQVRAIVPAHPVIVNDAADVIICQAWFQAATGEATVSDFMTWWTFRGIDQHEAPLPTAASGWLLDSDGEDVELGGDIANWYDGLGPASRVVSDCTQIGVTGPGGPALPTPWAPCPNPDGGAPIPCQGIGVTPGATTGTQ